MIQDDMTLHRGEKLKRRKAVDLNEEEWLHHIKRGGGVYLDDDEPQQSAQGETSAIEEVRDQFAQIHELSVSIDERLKAIEKQLSALQAAKPVQRRKPLRQFRGVNLAST